MSAAAGMLIPVHPVVRIISFLIFTLFLALGGLSQLAVAAVILVALYSMTVRSCFVNAWMMVRRLRWLFLSIVVIYAWLTPGQPLLGGAASVSSWLPTREGVLMGTHRLVVLIMMVLSAQWLLWATSRNQLVSALYWLAMPLVVTGFSRERFAVRMVLVLSAIEQVQARINEALAQVSLERGNLTAAVAAMLVSDVVQQAERESCHLIEIELENAPAPLQWLWPLLLTGVMLLAA